ncbi:MAG: DNA adenine methylase [Chitinophagaceae bacterium]|nr:DNA adenine methylase [Chitinophagaceae bacterium]MCW5925906.1 DNA adenine methylase [Chitinophagaceae bacterium]
MKRRSTFLTERPGKRIKLMKTPNYDSAGNFTARSPLRYPGGKTRAVEYISRFFPKHLNSLLSPFFGGGSIELSAAARGVKVYGYDVFPPLVEFWQSLVKQPDELADMVARYFPLSKENFYRLQQVQTGFRSKLERAAVYYVLNRSSFSGSTLSGGMSPGHPRFTESAIQRLREFYNPNIDVRKADFKRSLTDHPDMFAYIDPPYLIKNALYGKKGNTHRDFDHEGLTRLLKARENWILSYNDCDDIRDLYAGYPTITPTWKYGMSNDKSSREILIFSSKKLAKG